MSKLKFKQPTKAKPSRVQMAVYGEAGVGKTWACMGFAGPVCYVDCEGGASLPHYVERLEATGGAYLGPEDGACDFDTVLSQVRALTVEKHPFKTLVIDSFSKLFAQAIATETERLEAAKKKIEFGVERKPATAKARRLIAWLGQCDMNVILVCHTKAKWKDGEQIGTVPDGHDKISYDLNLVVEIINAGGQRLAKVRKSRFKQLQEGEAVAWEYKTFAELLGAEALEADHVPAEPATADQVNRAEHLCEVLSISESDVAKVFTNAGVTSWGEMTSDRIAAAITKLEGRLSA